VDCKTFETVDEDCGLGATESTIYEMGHTEESSRGGHIFVGYRDRMPFRCVCTWDCVSIVDAMDPATFDPCRRGDTS
jgi:hypothetical protein